MEKSIPGPGTKTNDIERVTAYVDGYNVYYGLKGKGWRRYLWLDFWHLFETELGPEQELVAVKYFTATNRKQSKKSSARQETYMQALASVGVTVRADGRFRKRSWKCLECEVWRKRPQEKRTDVSIAIEMIHDAHHDQTDTFWLMCADEDLIPAVSYIKQFHEEKVVVVLPPRGRRSVELIESADAKRDVSRARFSKAQLPDVIEAPDGHQLERPPEWK